MNPFFARHTFTRAQAALPPLFPSPATTTIHVSMCCAWLVMRPPFSVARFPRHTPLATPKRPPSRELFTDMCCFCTKGHKETENKATALGQSGKRENAEMGAANTVGGRRRMNTPNKNSEAKRHGCGWRGGQKRGTERHRQRLGVTSSTNITVARPGCRRVEKAGTMRGG